MKCIPALSVLAALGFVSCETMTAPIASGDFDPLQPPGSNLKTTDAGSGQDFSPGQFVRASMDNTVFFNKRPSGDADADKLLKRDTSMKVVSSSGSYVKVELDSGEVGFIPSVMLVDPNAVPQMASGSSNEVQVYPPLPSGPGDPLPVIDPAGLPPEGAIPTVIDPEAPAPTTAVPPVNPPVGTFPAPAPDAAAAPTTGAPLPPNGEEDEAE